MEITKTYLKDLVYKVNGAAIEVHKTLGPGLLESVYHQCLKYEMSKRKIQFESELIVPVVYDELVLDTHLRCDFFVEKILPVEIKAVDGILPIHKAQLLTYMNLLEASKGLLLNFNVLNLFKEGQYTMVNEMYRALPE